jgi:hypothetical protein
MKTTTKVILASISIAILSGCTPANFYTIKTPQKLKSKIKVVVPKNKDTKWVYIDNLDNFIGDKTGKEMTRQLAETFYTTAIYGKQHGYKYFAIIKEHTNNLDGFPINDFEQMLRYCNLKGHYRSRCFAYEHKESIITNHAVSLKVQYFKEPIPGIFMYDIEQTIQESKRYI